MSHPISKNRGNRERGSAMVEFALCFALIWIPLFTGVFYIGFNLVRSIQATQLCRDAGHMYSFGTDFSQTAQRSLLISLAPGLNITATTGNGLVVLSTITFVNSIDCVANGLQGDTIHCPNMNQTVFTRRISIGNAALHTSAFGTPASSIMDSSGSIAPSNYLVNTSARAANFSALIPLQSTQFAYVSEVWLSPWWTNTGGVGTSARSIF